MKTKKVVIRLTLVPKEIKENYNIAEDMFLSKDAMKDLLKGNDIDDINFLYGYASTTTYKMAYRIIDILRAKYEIYARMIAIDYLS